MSNKSHVLNITPPFDGRCSEVHNFEKIDCIHCNGSGKIKIHEDYLQLSPAEMDDCQRCDGSGKLNAKVVVKWSPDTVIIE